MPGAHALGRESHWAHRNPTFSFRSSGAFLLRFDARAFAGLLFQAPPRIERSPHPLEHAPVLGPGAYHGVAGLSRPAARARRARIQPPSRRPTSSSARARNSYCGKLQSFSFNESRL